MVFRNLGLKRPKIDPALAERVPPGQYVTERWPVLHYGDVPTFRPELWDLRVTGEVRNPVRLSWDEFQALPARDVIAAMHCVTRWSKLDMAWHGVAMAEILRLVEPLESATHVMFLAEQGYSANVPIEVASAPDVILATHANGEVLTPEHGYPLRAVIPQRYAWKSAKWLRGIEFMAADRKGFWENYGYHNNADYRNEERFATNGS